MPDGSIEKLLSNLRQRGADRAALTALNIQIDRDDLCRIKALSELYGVPLPELASILMAEILQQVEAKIPYKPGSNVIRVEDGEPIYEDIGDTPRYLQIKRKLETETS